ncbi:MAG TPA: 4Fe-4S dicluster domain-containing protein, partial [Geothrix sp.]|nr:4Fe-4S dicluster domain-containing protein [Geothrix sp.]
MTDPKPACPSEGCQSSGCGTTRRDFLGAATAAMAAALTGCDTLSREEFLQRNFKELSSDEVRSVIARLEKEYQAKYGRDVKVADTPPIPGVIFGYALDLSRCIGCRRCVHACVKENNQSRDPEVQWIRVLEMDKEEGVNVHHSDPYYDPAEVPREGHFYMPVQCQQCKKPPCTKVCPVGATWREKDGIVVVDYNWCIGCRYCMAACPYEGRNFNWADPNLPAAELNPETH